MRTDTIAAIATAMANSGIGIVRISGEDALSVIDAIFRSKSGQKKLSLADSHTIHYGYIYDDGILIDEVMALLMRAPNSYTREDTVEIDCHGGVLAVQRILEAALHHGARAAEPGEFTKRAFLNGRIDLSQAESVMDLIQSKNDFALANSISQLQGSVSEKIRDLRGRILHELARIEAALDDPEHHPLDGYGEVVHKVVDYLLIDVDKLIKSFQDGILLREGIRTVIVGKPNAGKSSLLNQMLGRDRAIVTPVAGTTRDILEEQLNIGGITLNVVDTAGIRSSDDIVEQIGVERAKQYVETADLLLYVVDASVPLNENDEMIRPFLSEKKSIILLNKSDLETVVDREDFSDLLETSDLPVISVSALDGSGMEILGQTIRELFFRDELSLNDEVYITNVRHKEALKEAHESLMHVKESIESGMSEDFYSIDLTDAYGALGRIVGETMGEDLVNEIFSKFCMGK